MQNNDLFTILQVKLIVPDRVTSRLEQLLAFYSLFAEIEIPDFKVLPIDMKEHRTSRRRKVQP